MSLLSYHLSINHDISSKSHLNTFILLIRLIRNLNIYEINNEKRWSCKYLLIVSTFWNHLSMSKELITSHYSIFTLNAVYYHAFRPMIYYSFQSIDRAFNQPGKYCLTFWMWSKPNWWNHSLSKLTMTLRWINVSCLLALSLRKILYTDSNLADLPEFHLYSCCQSKFFSFLQFI